MSHILVVDDERDNRETLEEVLSHLGHSCDMAGNVEEAVTKATSGKYQLVLMDMKLPLSASGDMDIYGGILATQQIKEIAHLKNLPIVAVTAHGFDHQREAILQSGCVEILFKGSDGFFTRTREVLARHLNTGQIRTPEIIKQAVATSKTTPHGRSNASEPAGMHTVPLSHAAVLVEDILVPPEQPSVTLESTQSVAISPMERVRYQVELAGRACEDLLIEMRSLECHKDLEVALSTLCEKLSVTRFRFRTRGPGANESLQHWVVNEIWKRQISLDFLRDLDQSHFGKFADRLAGIRALLTKIYEIFEPDGVQATSLVSKIVPVVVQSRHAGAPEPTVRVPESTHLRTLRLLVVDDDGEIRLAMERMLKELGYTAMSCGDGIQALDLLERQSFDLLLLDLSMPGLNGMQMIQHIREHANLKNLPIIVISGNGELSAAAEAIDRGANDYLTKPPHLPLLRARIESCMKQVNSRREELEKFLPAKVIDATLNDPDRMRQGRLAEVTVMFSDIRGFSRISEKVGAQETIRWISDVMDSLSSCILEHEGTLVDYVGDEVMAMWGAPQDCPNHAQQACRCALALQNTLVEVNSYWEARLGEPTQLGIGIHSGPAVVGNTASKHRFKYGPLGPVVNIASRVQGATKYMRSPVLITGETVRGLESTDRRRRLCTIEAVNIARPIELFELTPTIDNSEDRDELYELALKAFETNNFESAMRSLSELLNKHPKDGPTQLLMSRTIHAQMSGQKFSPVWQLPGK